METSYFLLEKRLIVLALCMFEGGASVTGVGEETTITRMM